MDKAKHLQEKAQMLHSLLEHYAKIDDDAEMVLKFMTPLFEEIQAGKIVPPKEHKYRWYFANTESPLYRKYEDLSHAAAEYARVLEEWDFPLPSSPWHTSEL